MENFINTTLLLLILLNPFLVIVYLIDILQKLSFKLFIGVLVRAGIISVIVFSVFAILGDSFFSNVLQADFASFQIFGGVIFLLIGIQFVFKGTSAIESLRGESEHIAGAIAMPILIGPGTISASVLAGKRLDAPMAILSITCALSISIVVMIFLKLLHDYVKPRNESLIERYIEIAGRITAIVIGTIAIEMIMKGTKAWFSIK